MRAALFPRSGLVEVVDGERREPSDEEVSVRVEACGICGTDLHIYHGEFPAEFPLIAGHEFAGVVEETGRNVNSLSPGDRVAVDPNLPCGVCRPCRNARPHLCRSLSAIGVTRDGGFATHCLIPVAQAYPIPEHVPFATAAMAEPVACCVHGIDRAGINAGEAVVLIGAGTIGLILLQLALLRGAGTAIVSEPTPEKRAAAEALGATRVVDPARQHLSEIVRETTGDSGVDVVIECVGSRETAQQAVELAAEGGRVLLFGVSPQAARITVSPFDVYRREVTITGSFTNPSTQARALALLSSGRVQVEALISHRLPLNQLAHGLDLLASRRATKIMIEPQR